MLYWHALTGEWFVNDYKYSIQNEGFYNWNTPKFRIVIFGDTGGWLTFSPMVLFILAGIILQFRKRIESPWGTLLVIIIVSYIYASWWHPSISNSFGHRGFVDYYPFMVFALASSVQAVFQIKNNGLAIFYKVLLTAFIFLSIRLSFMFRFYWWDIEWGWTEYGQTILKAFFINI